MVYIPNSMYKNNHNSILNSFVNITSCLWCTMGNILICLKRGIFKMSKSILEKELFFLNRTKYGYPMFLDESGYDSVG